MASFSWPISGGRVATYSTLSAFPSAASAGNGSLAIALDTDILYVSTGTVWQAIGGASAALMVGALDGQAANAQGLSLVANTLYQQSATASFPGLVNNTTQTFSGQKTFSTGLTGTLTGHATLDVATSSLGNLTDAGTDGITVTGGTGATVGNVSLSQHVADASHNGYLASTDWNNFNTSYLNVSAGPSKELWVDNHHPGTYTPDGSVLRPFTTIAAALAQIVTNADNATYPYVILLAPGNYNETISLNNSLYYNLNFAGINTSQGQSSVVSIGPGTSTVITSTSNNTQLANVSFNNITLNGDIILTGDVNGTNFASGTFAFIGCNIQKYNTGILLTNINNPYFYDCSFNSTGTGPITFTNVAFAVLEQGDGIHGNISMSLVNNGGGNQPSQFLGNYFLMERSTLSPNTLSIDAGSEIDTVGGYMNGATSLTLNGIWHCYGTIINTPVTLNNGSTLNIRGAFFSGAVTVNAGATLNNQGKLRYTPGTSGNWNSVPVEVFAALDTLASSGIVKSQSQNLVLASPNGSSGVPSFRAIVGADVTANTLTNSTLAQMGAHTYKGNNTGSTATPIDVTSTQLTADLNLFTSSLQGLVPASGGGTTNFLRADGTFAAPSGSFTNPMTTAGDIIYENATPAPARLPIGSTGQVLTVVAGLPAWSAVTSTGNLNAKFSLSDAVVPFTCIDGPHYQAGTQSLTTVNISMFNSGTSGSTVIQVNQYRSGSLQASATASLSANAGKPSGTAASLSGTLSLLAGDIITVDVNSVAGGAPECLSVEY